MSLETIDINKNYAIYLSDLYGGTKYNVQIIGKTFIDSVAKNQDDYNIYTTYFEPIGLGISSYYTAISSDTPIYICLPITALEPFTLSSTKMFIPGTLINMEASEEYVKAFNINFNISSVIKAFDTDAERDSYLEEIIGKIKIRLNALIDFSISDLDLTSVYDEVYLTTDDVAAINEARNTAYDEYIKRQQTINQDEISKNLAIAAKLKELDTQIATYKTLQDVTLVKNQQLQDAIDAYEAWHNTV
jgi:hypothetical protein